MTRKPQKNKRKPTSNSGKDASPRGGLKSKQTKVQSAAGTEPTGPQQTKIKFAPTVTTMKALPTTPKSAPTLTTTAITPEPSQATVNSPSARLKDPPELSNTEKSTTTTETDAPKTKETYAEKTKVSDTSTYITPTTTTTTSNTPTPTTTTTTTPEEDNQKPAATTTTRRPAANTETFGKYKAIRYRCTIDAPPNDKPLPAFVTLLKKFITTVQETLSKNIYLAPWDKDQEATFPIIKTKEDVPESRESLGIYLGTYINPKTDGGKVYMNMRWVAYRKPPVPLDRFGTELCDALPRHQMFMNKQPQACQSAKTACIGWFMYSSKQMNSTTFVPETKAALGIPQEVEIGISYCTIVDECGKRPKYDREDPPAAAIHLDIDEKFYMVYQPKAS